MSVLVETGDQIGLARSVEASTTTSVLVAQEILKPKPLVSTPKLGPKSRMTGSGRNQSRVGLPPNVGPQPVVPGK